jgi:transposase
MDKFEQASERRVLGADVSLEKFDAGIAGPGSSQDLRSIKVRAFPRTLEGAGKCLEWMDQAGGADAVVMEATGYYSRELLEFFHQHRPSLPGFIANPFLIKRYGEGLGVRTKTDAQDARVIACYGVERKLRPFREKSPEHKELERLHKDRDALVDMLKSEQQRALGAVRNATAQKVHERLSQELKQGIKDLDQEIRRVVKTSESLEKQVDLMVTIPGVGLHTATLSLGLLGDFTQFERGRQLSSFAGTAPKLKDSGKTVHGRTVLVKRGHPRIRKALFLSAMTAVRQEGPLRQIYLDLIAKGKAKKSALGAIMRRILLLMRAVLSSGLPFDPGRMGKPQPAVS